MFVMGNVPQCLVAETRITSDRKNWNSKWPRRCFAQPITASLKRDVAPLW